MGRVKDAVWWLGFVILLGAVLAGKSWFRAKQRRERREVVTRSDPDLVRVRLPGASLDLPRGALTRAAHDYWAGEVRVAGEDGEVTLAWRRASRLPELDALDASRELVEYGRGQVNVSTLARGATQRRLHGRDGEVDVRVTSFVCGRRGFVLIVSGDPSEDTLSMSGTAKLVDERVRESFRCTPDAAEERRPPPAEVVPLPAEAPAPP